MFEVRFIDALLWLSFAAVVVFTANDVRNRDKEHIGVLEALKGNASASRVIALAACFVLLFLSRRQGL